MIKSNETNSVDAVHGNHTNMKSNDDVDCLFLYHWDLRFFTSNFVKIFKNIKGIFTRTTVFREIRQKDLKPFPHLTHISIESGI